MLILPRKITVRAGRVNVRGKVLEQTTTKIREGLRTVPLSDAAVGALLSWQPRQAEEAKPPRMRGALKGALVPAPRGRGTSAA
jgi:DNA mismatch repair protein MutH